MSRLAPAWENLSGDRQGEGYVRLRVSAAGECPVYAARRLPDGQEAILLEVDTAALPLDLKLESTAGLRVDAQPLLPGPSGRTRIVVEPGEARYVELFHVLAEDLVACVLTATSQTDGLKVLVARLARWQAFLRRHGEGLGIEARRGLFGELWFLRDRLLPAVDPDTAVRAWRGWSRAVHDFQLEGGTVEIKTTAAASPLAVHVNNIRQLDDTRPGKLFLCVVVVQESENVGITLPEMIATIQSGLQGLAVDAFQEGLLESGYVETHAPHYSSPRYSVRRDKWFEVVEGFPRLRESDLPSGISEVRYAVALAACSPFERPPGEALNAVLGPRA